MYDVRRVICEYHHIIVSYCMVLLSDKTNYVTSNGIIM